MNMMMENLGDSWIHIWEAEVQSKKLKENEVWQWDNWVGHGLTITTDKNYLRPY